LLSEECQSITVGGRVWSWLAIPPKIGVKKFCNCPAHTRHKSSEMVARARYVREADKWTKSGLKSVGF